MTNLQEIRLYHKAAKDAWEISDEERAKTVQRVIELRDNAESEQVQITACKTLLMMESQNIANRHKELDRLDAAGNRVLAFLGGAGSTQVCGITDGDSAGVVEVGSIAVPTPVANRTNQRRESR